MRLHLDTSTYNLLSLQARHIVEGISPPFRTDIIDLTSLFDVKHLHLISREKSSHLTWLHFVRLPRGFSWCMPIANTEYKRATWWRECNSRLLCSSNFKCVWNHKENIYESIFCCTKLSGLQAKRGEKKNIPDYINSDIVKACDESEVQ